MITTEPIIYIEQDSNGNIITTKAIIKTIIIIRILEFWLYKLQLLLIPLASQDNLVD